MNMPLTKEQVFTLGSTANLDNLVVGDSLVMTDENGTVVSHANETSTIVNVVEYIRNWVGAASSSNGYYPGREPQYGFDWRNDSGISTNTDGTLTWNPGIGGPTGDCIRGKFTGLFRVFVNDGSGNAVEKYTVGDYTGNFVMSETYFDKKEQVMKLIGTNNRGETCGWFYFNVGPLRMQVGPGNYNVEAICENNNDLRSFQFVQRTQSRIGEDCMVIGVDVEANKIILDGGRYTATDGTACATPDIQDDQGFQTKVTVKNGGIMNISGTANYKSHDGTTLTVSNSNAQFVAEPNSANKTYYMKNASSRTGLAILRSKAAELATTFNLTTTYQTGDLVIFNDCYWVRDNGSWLKISESTTTY